MGAKPKKWDKLKRQFYELMRDCSPDRSLSCAYCGSGPLKRGQVGKKSPLNMRASVDHFEPKHLTHIHSYDMRNFVVSCIACNNEKDGLEGVELEDWVRTRCAERRKNTPDTCIPTCKE